MKASITLLKVLSEVFTFTFAKLSSQVSARLPPCPLLILLSRVTDLALSVVYVNGLTAKYTFIAFIQWTASSVSPEKSAGSAALISVVLVVVDVGFAGGGAGLAGSCGSGIVGGSAVVNEVVEAGGLVVDTAGVMEFVPLHDIPYIFLSPDSQPDLSINKFLTSPDQYWNLSTFIPNASFP